MDDVLGLVRYALGFTLALAAAWKVKEFGAFRRSLGSYGLHGRVGSVGAAALVGAEALTAALCFGAVGDLARTDVVLSDLMVSDRVAGVAGTALGVCFSVAQTYLLSSGKPAPCLCFGAAAAEPVSLRSWSRSVLVLLAGLVLMLVGRPDPRPFDPVLAAGGLLLLGVLSVLHRRLPPATGSSQAAPPASDGAASTARRPVR